MNNAVLQPVLSNIYRCDININCDRYTVEISAICKEAKKSENSKIAYCTIILRVEFSKIFCWPTPFGFEK